MENRYTHAMGGNAGSLQCRMVVSAAPEARVNTHRQEVANKAMQTDGLRPPLIAKPLGGDRIIQAENVHNAN